MQDILFYQGLFWCVIKGDQMVMLLGIYYFDDLCYVVIMVQFGLLIDKVVVFLVEVGFEEEEKLGCVMVENLVLIFDFIGLMLFEWMEKEEWDMLWKVLELCGLFVVVISWMWLWYVLMMLGILFCMMVQVKVNGDIGGLDYQLIVCVQVVDVFVCVLELWDMVFMLF